MTPRYPIGNRLEGKVALISGGARGMGESHARAFVAQGANVVIADILDSEGEAVAAELGDAVAYVHLDVTDRDQWARAVATARERFGKLNVLVNNAGIATAGAIGEYAPERWDAIIAVNLTGVFNGITASLDALKAGSAQFDHQRLVDRRPAGVQQAPRLHRFQVRRARLDQVGRSRPWSAQRSLQLGPPRSGGHADDGWSGCSAEPCRDAPSRPA